MIKEIKDCKSPAEMLELAQENIARGTCVICHESGIKNCTTDLGIAEFGISGICEICFEDMFKDMEDA